MGVSLLYVKLRLRALGRDATLRLNPVGPSVNDLPQLYKL